MTTKDNKVTGSWWLRLNYTITNYPDRVVISADGGPYANSMNVQSSLKMSATCELTLYDQVTSGTATFYTITSGTYKSAVSGSKTLYKGHEDYWSQVQVWCKEAYDDGGNITGLWHLGGYASGLDVNIPSKDSWTVSFNANGGSNSPNSQTKWYNENLTLSTSKPSRTGYSFIKWNTKADGTGTDYNPGVSYTANADLTLYAIWYPTVTYNANGGSGAPAQVVKTPGTPITISTTQPTRSGYTFSKWNTSTDGSGTDYSSGASYSTDAPLVLYAQWTPNTYQVSFDANTGKHAPSAISKTYGQPVALPSTVPVKMAADFIGWATNSSGTGTLYQPGGSYNSTVAAAEILYAVWRSNYTDPAFAIDVVRTDEHGSEEDDGDHVKISVLWSIHPLVEPDTGKSTNTATFVCYMSYVDEQEQTITTEVTLHDTQLYAEEETLSIAGVVADPVEEPQDTKTSGEMQAIVPADTDIRYTIEVTVTDSRDTSVTKTEVLATAFFTMDFLAGGHGIALGKPAKREMFDVGMQTQFDMPIKVAETDVPPTFYFTTKPVAADLPVRPCIVIQTSDWSVWYCDNETSPSYHQLNPPTDISGKVSKSGDTMTGALTVNASITSKGAPGFLSSVSAGSWSYLRLHNGSNYWDIATNSSVNGGSLDFRPSGTDNKGPRINTAGRMDFANTGSATNTSRYTQAAIQIRETNYGGSGSDTWGRAPRLAFHWSGRVANEIGLASSGWLHACPGSSAGSTTMSRIMLETGGSWNIHASQDLALSGGTLTGLLHINTNSVTSHWGSQNNGWVHLTNDQNKPYYIGKTTHIDGDLYRYNGSIYWDSGSCCGSYGDARIYRFIYAGSYAEASTSNHGVYGISWWASDARMKDNIEDSDTEALDVVNSIRHRSFDMDGEHCDVGYVAQELKELEPRFIFKVPQNRQVNGESYFTGDYRYQIDPNKVIPYLSKAIQELSDKVEKLEARVAELEGRQ